MSGSSKKHLLCITSLVGFLFLAALLVNGCGGAESEMEEVVSQIEAKVDKILEIASQAEAGELGEEDANRYIETISNEIVELEKRFNALADELEGELTDEKKAQYGLRVVVALAKLNGV